MNLHRIVGVYGYPSILFAGQITQDAYSGHCKDLLIIVTIRNNWNICTHQNWR